MEYKDSKTVTAQKSNNQSNNIQVFKSELRFMYNDNARGLFENWRELLRFWTPYYGWTGSDRHFRNHAYGGIYDKWGYEVASADKTGPLTAAEKKKLMTQTSETYTGRPVEIGTQE